MTFEMNERYNLSSFHISWKKIKLYSLLNYDIIFLVVFSLELRHYFSRSKKIRILKFILFFALHNATLLYYFFNNVREKKFLIVITVFARRETIRNDHLSKSEHSVRLVICSSILDVFDCLLPRILEKTRRLHGISILRACNKCASTSSSCGACTVLAYVYISIYSHAYSLSSRMRWPKRAIIISHSHSRTMILTLATLFSFNWDLLAALTSHTFEESNVQRI